MEPNSSDTVEKKIRMFIVSGGLGTLGENMVRTVTAQFEGLDPYTEIFAHTSSEGGIESIVKRAAYEDAAIVHSLVVPEHKAFMVERAKKYGVESFDVVGPLMEYLRDRLNAEPIGKPGMYRQLHESYFRRIDAIEFTIEHDDGVNPSGWAQAEIVITGVSRVSKTPLSLYLSMLGWKVANVPLVPEIPPRPELFELDKRRVVGITMDPSQVIQHRQVRQARLQTGAISPYSDPESVYEELQAAKQIFRKGGFRSIDVTGKPIETSADEIVQLVTKRLRKDLPK